jgi:hypothetical protein
VGITGRFLRDYCSGFYTLRRDLAQNGGRIGMIFKTALAAFAVLAATIIAAPQAAVASDVLKSGTIIGQAGHKAGGSVKIVKGSHGVVTKVVLSSAFFLRGAPDPKLAWGKGGYKRGTIFTKLRKTKGAQEYVVPAGTDLSKYTEFWIWCERHNVPLAMAKLK